MAAINLGTGAIGVVTPEGIVFVAEKRATTKLLDKYAVSEKMFRVSSDMGCAVAGRSADAHILVDYARVSAQEHLAIYDEPISVEEEVEILCDMMHGYTQFGGMRPFGVSMLLAGWDKYHGYQLYQTDPSGNYALWKAASIGKKASGAVSALKEEWIEGMTMAEATQIALKVMVKTLDTVTLETSKIEISRFYRKDKKSHFDIVKEKESSELIKKFNSVMEKEDAAKREKEERMRRARGL